MFLIIFCLHRRLISDLHISLCISLNQLQDTSTNAHFVQVSWSKLAASCWPHWLNSLNPRAILFHKLCTKTRLQQALAHRWQLTGMFSFSAMSLPTTAATSPSPSPSLHPHPYLVSSLMPQSPPFFHFPLEVSSTDQSSRAPAPIGFSLGSIPSRKTWMLETL